MQPFSVSCPELHQTQPVAAQPLHAHAERGHGQELLVDAEPRGRQERQVAPPESGFHGQQQQVHQVPGTGRQEKGGGMGVVLPNTKAEPGGI